tara:strand:- start:1032 stop:1760 length:729 start_codon:yes stop_codon:yes gene_type:complete
MKLFLIDNEEIESDAVMSTLRKTGYIKNIVKELILEKILSDQEVNPLEVKKILDNYKIEQNLDTEEKYISFLEEKLINEELLIEMLLRPTKIIRYREERWGQRANSLYLKYKDDYDLVTFNILQSTNEHVMQEVYFRIKDNEETWETMAKQFYPNKLNASAKRGPVPISKIDLSITEEMKKAGIGRITKPFNVKDQVVIAELEKLEAKRFDENLRKTIINREFENWLNQETIKLTKKLSFHS